MQHRIRAAAIVVQGDSVLLVQHQHNDLQGGRPWWVPPGGGVEGEESLMDCAQREVLEETGLSVELGQDRLCPRIRRARLPSLRGVLHCSFVLRYADGGAIPAPASST